MFDEAEFKDTRVELPPDGEVVLVDVLGVPRLAYMRNGMWYKHDWLSRNWTYGSSTSIMYWCYLPQLPTKPEEWRPVQSLPRRTVASDVYVVGEEPKTPLIIL